VAAEVEKAVSAAGERAMIRDAERRSSERSAGDRVGTSVTDFIRDGSASIGTQVYDRTAATQALEG